MRRLFFGLAIALACAASASVAQAGDQEAAQQIASNLRTSGVMKGYHIGVTVRGGTAVLDGTVSSPDQKLLALAIARQSAGVQQIIDNLTVIGPAGQQAVASAPAHPPQYAQPAGAAAAAPIRAAAAGVQHAGPQIPLAAGPSTSLPASYAQPHGAAPAMLSPVHGAVPAYPPGLGGTVAPVRYDRPHLPPYAWPSYAAHPNYAAVTYPKQYSPTAWPFIGPFYPYPQVPLGWRKVTLEWDDGWWMLDFKARRH